MARLPEALDVVLARISATPEASYIESMHELGISTEEAVALVVEVLRQSENRAEGVAIGVYLGIMLGRELSS